MIPVLKLADMLQERIPCLKSKLLEGHPASTDASWGIVEASLRGKEAPEDHIPRLMSYTLTLLWRCRRRLQFISSSSRAYLSPLRKRRNPLARGLDVLAVDIDANERTAKLEGSLRDAPAADKRIKYR